MLTARINGTNLWNTNLVRWKKSSTISTTRFKSWESKNVTHWRAQIRLRRSAVQFWLSITLNKFKMRRNKRHMKSTWWLMNYSSSLLASRLSTMRSASLKRKCFPSSRWETTLTLSEWFSTFSTEVLRRTKISFWKKSNPFMIRLT